MNKATQQQSKIQRLLNNAIIDFRDAIYKTFEVLLTSEDKEHRKTSCLTARARMESLQQFIVTEDIPPWFDKLAAALQSVGTGGASHTVNDLGRILRENWQSIEAFSYELDSVPVHNFTDVYRENFDRLHIEKDFMLLADQLEAIIATGEVQAIRALSRLQELVGLLRRNRRGNYLHLLGTFAAVVAAKHTLYELAVSVPVVAPLVKAAAATMKELDVSIPELSEKVVDDIKLKFSDSWPVFAVPALPPSELDKLNDSDIIEVGYEVVTAKHERE